MDQQQMNMVLSDHSLFDITDSEAAQTIDTMCSLYDKYLMQFDSSKVRPLLDLLVKTKLIKLCCVDKLPCKKC